MFSSITGSIAGSITDSAQVHRRKRGVILSPQGWQRLQLAEQQAAETQNAGKIYTLEQLGERTGLSPNTITKVRRRRLAVDRQTLEVYFATLSLTLQTDDYISLDSDLSLGRLPQKPLQGQIPLDSAFYIERPPIDLLAYEEVLQPGSLIRIKAPRQFGKTSLMARIVATAQTRNLRSTVLNLRLADAAIFQDLDRFLRWFCAVITRELQLPNRLDDHWNAVFGSSYSCTDYFETYLLPELNGPLVLALDEVDAVFEHPQIASDFFGLLRAWHEKSRYGTGTIWQQLRLVVVHSTEVYLPLDLSQSPFTVGLLLDLPHLTPEQVQELAQRYEIDSSDTAARLSDLLGGIPHLTQLALHHLSQLSVPQLSQRELPFDRLMPHGTTPDSLFSAHLRRRLTALQPYPDLLRALQQVVQSSGPVELPPTPAFQLQGMGLVHLVHLQALPTCKLYRDYFAQVLPIIAERP